MDDLLSRVATNITEQSLFSRGEGFIVAVSGGLDSTVLLRVLYELAASNEWGMTVAHFNHRLRGRSSTADEQSVCRCSAKLGLPVVIERADVRGFARQHKLSIEMAARKLRHEFLTRAARRVGARTIALAHHADDQVELFFVRLLRGSGSDGLAGMPWRNPSPADAGVFLVRPLLSETKESLRQFAAGRRLRFREDATNTCLDIQRNRIRHELLPLLERHYQPAISTVVRRVMEITRSDKDCVDEQAAEWLAGKVASNRSRGDQRPKTTQPFTALPVAVQRRCIIRQLRDLGFDADFELVERLRKVTGRPVCVQMRTANVAQEADLGTPATSADSVKKQNLVLREEDGLLSVLPPDQPMFDVSAAPIDVTAGRGSIIFDGLRVSWRCANRLKRVLKRLNWKELFDAVTVGSAIILRHWRKGDRYQPIGMSQKVKLQDFFTNQKVPRAARHQRVVATTATGEIFWVEGCRISERFKLTNSTTRCLLWHWERL